MTRPTQTDECIDHGCCSGVMNYTRKEHNGRLLGAHVVALILATGEQPNGRQALHSCDNRRCVNPQHLRWGTQAENMEDMVKRGRWRSPTGTAHYLSDLTDDDIIDIRASYVPRSKTHGQTALALKHGVTQPTISRILQGHRYKEVAEH